MDKPITLRGLFILYELYEKHSNGFGYEGCFGSFIGWILRVQDDDHEGAGHCHHCKLAWAAINKPEEATP
jgi:hypothetical protein